MAPQRRGERGCRLRRVAIGVTRGRDTLVDLEEIDELPRQAGRCEDLEDALRRPAAAHGERRAAVARNVVADVTREELGRALGDRGRARPNLDLGSRDVQHSSPVCGVRHAPTSASASGGPQLPAS